MQRVDGRRIELQQRLAARQHDVAVWCAGRSIARRWCRVEFAADAKRPPSVPSVAEEIGVAECDSRMGAVLLADAPQVAAAKRQNTEHDRHGRLRPET